MEEKSQVYQPGFKPMEETAQSKINKSLQSGSNLYSPGFSVGQRPAPSQEKPAAPKPPQMTQEGQDVMNWDLANIAYSSPSERQSHLESKYGGRFRVDPRFNYDNYSAVYDSYNHRLYHLHRGTVNWDDAGTDALLAVGQVANSQRYRDTEERVRLAHAAYGSAAHSHIGHSLGGTLADTFARQYNDKSIAYNMGSTPFGPRHVFDDQHRHVRIGTDFVSSFQQGQGVETQNKRENRLDKLLKNVRLPFGSGLSGSLQIGAGLAHKVHNTYQSHFLDNFFH